MRPHDSGAVLEHARGVCLEDGGDRVTARARRATRPHQSLRAVARWGWILVLGVLLMGLASGTTLAAWRSSQAVPGGSVYAGNLSVTATTLAWECPDQDATGDAASLPDLVLAPGQTVVLRQTVVPTIAGDNLYLALGVELDSPPAGAVVTWHVEAGGVQAAPALGEAALDETLAVPLDAEWVVVVTLTLPAGDPAWGDPTSGPSPEPLSLGVMTVSAHQVRCGGGFAVTCLGTEVGNA